MEIQKKTTLSPIMISNQGKFVIKFWTRKEEIWQNVNCKLE